MTALASRVGQQKCYSQCLTTHSAAEYKVTMANITGAFLEQMSNRTVSTSISAAHDNPSVILNGTMTSTSIIVPAQISTRGQPSKEETTSPAAHRRTKSNNNKPFRPIDQNHNIVRFTDEKRGGNTVKSNHHTTRPAGHFSPETADNRSSYTEGDMNGTRLASLQIAVAVLSTALCMIALIYIINRIKK